MYKRIQYRLDLSSYERLDTDKWYNRSNDHVAIHFFQLSGRHEGQWSSVSLIAT